MHPPRTHHAPTTHPPRTHQALSKLKDIRDTQNAMADEAAWARLPNRQRQQRQQQLSQSENTARYFMQFTNEVLHMLSYLSAEKDVAVGLPPRAPPHRRTAAPPHP